MRRPSPRRPPSRRRRITTGWRLPPSSMRSRPRMRRGAARSACAPPARARPSAAPADPRAPPPPESARRSGWHRAGADRATRTGRGTLRRENARAAPHQRRISAEAVALDRQEEPPFLELRHGGEARRERHRVGAVGRRDGAHRGDALGVKFGEGEGDHAAGGAADLGAPGRHAQVIEHAREGVRLIVGGEAREGLSGPQAARVSRSPR